jgi:uncharacterized protein YmfQ (DUF2313 family)
VAAPGRASRPPSRRWSLKGLAGSFARLNDDANGLLVDAFPATAVQLLPEWEETLNLPGTGSTSERQAAIVAALTATGGQSKAYFIALAASLGFAITITEYRPHRVSDTVSRPIAGADTIFSWLVTTRASGSHTALEAAIRQYAPAHTVVGFNYV